MIQENKEASISMMINKKSDSALSKSCYISRSNIIKVAEDSGSIDDFMKCGVSVFGEVARTDLIQLAEKYLQS
ncbi:hypothetical protein [Leclercia sp. GLN_9]|uniref:hypothetical protein n=1 Tax=Leclercia sp. GLN_9 TaxID=3367184 RepID=UPI00370A16D3